MDRAFEVDAALADLGIDLTEAEYAQLLGACLAGGAPWARTEGLLRRMGRELTMLQARVVDTAVAWRRVLPCCSSIGGSPLCNTGCCDSAVAHGNPMWPQGITGMRLYHTFAPRSTLVLCAGVYTGCRREAV